MFHCQVKEEKALGSDHYLLLLLFSGRGEGGQFSGQ